MNIADQLKTVIKGEVETATETLDFYSHDASLFEVVPEVIVFPKDSTDVQALVKYVAAEKSTQPNLSITARSAGTDMSGGAINDSIVADFNRHFTAIFQPASEHSFS